MADNVVSCSTLIIFDAWYDNESAADAMCDVEGPLFLQMSD